MKKYHFAIYSCLIFLLLISSIILFFQNSTLRQKNLSYLQQIQNYDTQIKSLSSQLQGNKFKDRSEQTAILELVDDYKELV